MSKETGATRPHLATFLDLKIDCDYWDVRIEDSFETSIDMVDGEVVTCTSSPSLGAFVRLKKEGFWLYESTTELDQLKEILIGLSQQKVPEKSEFNFTPKKQEPLTKITAAHKKYSDVPLSDKLALVQKYSALLHANECLNSTNFRYRDIYKVKSFINSVGTQFDYDFNQGGIVGRYTLKEAEILFDDKFVLYGAEFRELLNQESMLEKAMNESEKFLKAPAITPGKYKVLLDPEVTGVFTHESFGHKSEADFMIGNTEAFEEWKLGKKIGADVLTIVEFGGHENTSGYCPVDDDGTPAQKNYLIKNGILSGRLHNIDTAAAMGESLTGNSRAMNFEFEPMVRMTSTYIEPGTESIDSILQRSEGAILVEGVKHGSGLSTFTIAPTRGYKIGPGGTKEPVRLAVISGSVFDTLNNIEAVSSEFELHSSAVGGCGKMDQWPLPVSDGGPYILVKDMQVS